MAGLLAGLILLVAAAPAYGKDYTVGDSSGWTSGVDYNAWAKGKTFIVGDSLSFQYNFMHTVAEVSSADYSACSASNSIQSYSDQNTKITLTKPGTRYFICGTSGHCSNGMKLAVTAVSPSTTAPSTSPTTPALTPTTPSTTPLTPSTETPSTTTTPAATTPAATTPSTAKSSEKTSGATGSGAGLVLGLSFGAMGLALMG